MRNKLIDFEKLKEKELIYVYSTAIAELLVNQFGIGSLAHVGRDKYNKEHRVYMFINSPQLLDEFKKQIMELEEARIKND